MKRRASHQTESHRTEPGDVRPLHCGLRALIVDDESLARQGVRMLLEGDADISFIEEATNGKQAAELILAGDFDLIFLDVQIPEMDGFAALRRARANVRGAVIFVTAYDHYAVEAFEVNAADYLLKPFTPHRFRQALQRQKPEFAVAHREAIRACWQCWSRLRASQRTSIGSRCEALPARTLWKQKMWIG